MDPSVRYTASNATVSVIINTNGRVFSLEKTLAALSHQRFRDFEVCLVCGPAQDGTHDFAQAIARGGAAKIAFCDQVNLSVSRNLGLRMSAGALVAFLDDDALPEPVWLEQLVSAFHAPDIAGASGLVLAPNGWQEQFRFSLCDRFGDAFHGLTEPGDAFAFPMSARFPHAMGTNCMFRRHALVAIGGFDEEYDYYLDETDVCCRLVDAGHAFRQLATAPVHHKFLPGVVRDGSGAVVKHYAMMKNRIYFALVNGREHASMSEIIAGAGAFIDRRRADVGSRVRAGMLDAGALEIFEAEADEAWAVGLARGLSGERRLREPSFFADPLPFLPFFSTAAPTPGAREHIAVLLPDRRAQPDLFVEALASARARAKDGALVRAISLCGDGEHDGEGVDIAEELWLHRLVPRIPASGSRYSPMRLDAETWKRASALQEALKRIDGFQRIDAIEDWTGDALTIACAFEGDARVRLGGRASDARHLRRTSAL